MGGKGLEILSLNTILKYEELNILGYQIARKSAYN